MFRKNRGTTLALLLFTGCWSSGAEPARAPIANTPPAGPVTPLLKEVAAAEFGIWDRDGSFHVTYDVPLRAGSTFGWRLFLPCTTPLVPIQEELRLPAPGDWGDDPEMQISRDRKAVHVRASLECVEGWIEKQWSVTAGDPPGVWAVRITAAGYATKTFRASFTASPLAPPGP